MPSKPAIVTIGQMNRLLKVIHKHGKVDPEAFDQTFPLDPLKREKLQDIVQLARNKGLVRRLRPGNGKAWLVLTELGQTRVESVIGRLGG